MPRQKIMLPLLLCLSALLSACASSAPVQPRTVYVTAEVPQSLRDCRRAPSWPALEARARKAQRNASQAEVAEFVALLSNAHQDCRTKLLAVNRLLTRVEARAKR
jgi:outer membrane biogenesis lipoprotein LolB